MKHAKLFFILALALALCVLAVPASADENPYLGEPLDDFSVTTITGETFTLSEALAEKDMVLINLWATWCGPCEMEFPYMQEAYELYEDRVEIIALSIEPTDTDDVLTEYAEAHGMTFPVANEGGLGLREKFVSTGIPTTVVVDRFGNVALVEVGSQTSADAFRSLFDYFTDDGYTETVVLDGIPPLKPDAVMPDAAELAAVLGEGDGIALRLSEDEYTWPMIPAEKDGRAALVNANAGQSGTEAALYANVTAAEGDVLAFDVACSTVPVFNLLTVSVDGEPVKYFGGERDFTSWAIPLDEGGHVVTFAYAPMDTSDSSLDCVWLSDIRLLSGEAAEAALAALPVYPVGDEFALTIRNEDARQIVFTGEDAAFVYEDSGVEQFYIVPGGEVTVEGSITSDVDPEAAFFYSDYDGSVMPLADALTDQGEFLFSSGIDTVDTTWWAFTGINMYRSIMMESPEDIASIIVFADEENLNSIVEEMREDDGLNVSWTYADATAPATDETAEILDDDRESADDGEAALSTYEVHFVDQNDQTVPGCIINFCTDESCTTVTADENGVAFFTGEPYPYHLQIIKVPDGYEFDTTQEFYAGEGGENICFTITKQ